VQHPWILPDKILAQAGFHAFNLHNAALPLYKGHNTCNHAILNGDEIYVSTVHWMVAEVDSGPIALEESVQIAPDETARSLYQKALTSGEIVFRRLLELLLSGSPVPRTPMLGQSVFYPRSSLDALRDITDLPDATVADRRIRALFFPPFEPAYLRVAGRKQYVLPARFVDFAAEFAPTFGLVA
jgi:methionyl-tRNA formyltransferase